ncbi:hypothetical protein TSUD_115750 [Trifolium subterraneum]|uniref:Uncharacterized protein n=1 Tax=Trifolium subterraneum TaxID=3900 RepID=A0A2Z6MHI3_TRISU|nr:hypothetical protein TSUD_115750 [Trifolium subterraneum]
MVFKKLNTAANPFLNLPLRDNQFDATTSRVTVQMVFKKLNTAANPFLNLPLRDNQFDATTSRVTVQIYQALQVANPTEEDFNLLFENVCARKGGVTLEWFSDSFESSVPKDFRSVADLQLEESVHSHP